VTESRRLDLAHDLILPTLLFGALGGMTWAVRGSSGFGTVWGCVFAGVTWGVAWWYLARDPSAEQSRRYASGWVVLAITLGVGLAGERGWMQWPSFFAGRLVFDSRTGEFQPISRGYGFLWMFIAGVPWAGLGACLLAWCGSLRETRIWHWILRIAFGVGFAALGRLLVKADPQDFLPLYTSLESRYHDLKHNHELGKLVRDNADAMTHLGCYVGFLLFEILRRDWKNTLLILAVGVLNGVGWALLQCWNWAPGVWPHASFNFWRCWESSGGISIGVAYGIAYFLVNRPMSEGERTAVAARRSLEGPNFEWILVYFGLTSFAYLFLANRLHGWAEIYFSVVIALGAAYYFAHRGASRWLVALMAIGLICGFFARRMLVALETSPEYYFGEHAPTALEYLRALLGRGQLLFWERYSVVAMGVGVLVMAVGVLWYAVNYSNFEKEKESNTPNSGDPNLERFGLSLGLLVGLGISLTQGIKGWFNIYKGDENYWDRAQWHYFGWIFLGLLLAIGARLFVRPLPRDFRGDRFPQAYGILWSVLVLQNVIAQCITGPIGNWNEMAFNIYYVLLFAITAVIAIHYHSLKTGPLSAAPFAGSSSANRLLGGA
jgi:hypothetical protein